MLSRIRCTLRNWWNLNTVQAAFLLTKKWNYMEQPCLVRQLWSAEMNVWLTRLRSVSLHRHITFPFFDTLLRVWTTIVVAKRKVARTGSEWTSLWSHRREGAAVGTIRQSACAQSPLHHHSPPVWSLTLLLSELWWGEDTAGSRRWTSHPSTRCHDDAGTTDENLVLRVICTFYTLCTTDIAPDTDNVPNLCGESGWGVGRLIRCLPIRCPHLLLFLEPDERKYSLFSTLFKD